MSKVANWVRPGARYDALSSTMRVPYRILRHGLAVTELAENDLPGVPSAVFAFKEVKSRASCVRAQANIVYIDIPNLLRLA